MSRQPEFQPQSPSEPEPGLGVAVELRATLSLALPLIAGQVGQMLMGVADTVMIGRVGVVELGVASLVSALSHIPLLLGFGLLTAVSVKVSQARGAGQQAAAREAVRHGTWLAGAFALLVLALTALAVPRLHWLGQPAEVTDAMPPYLWLVMWSMVPMLLGTAWKNHADAMSLPWPPFVIMLAGVLLNVFLNWLLIYGNWGLPRLELVGAGWATLLARTATALALLVWLLRTPRLRGWVARRWGWPIHGRILAGMLAIGVPASLHLLTEVTAFAAAAILIGTLGAVPLAAHQIAITCAATTFMVPLGLAMALTVRIGEVTGSRQPLRRGPIHRGGWWFAGAFMSLSMITFILAGGLIAGWFIDDTEVVRLATGLLVIAGVFQLFDGWQVVAAGSLRGIGDVRIPALIALAAYWGVALPLGALLAFRSPLGAHGVWLGLAAGLALAACALGLRCRRLLTRTASSAPVPE